MASPVEHFTCLFILSWKITSWEKLSSKLFHRFPCQVCVEGQKGHSTKSSHFDPEIKLVQFHFRLHNVTLWGERFLAPHMSSQWLWVCSPHTCDGHPHPQVDSQVEHMVSGYYCPCIP